MARLLLVEDDNAIVKSLKEYLTGEGFEITSTPGQREAEELIRQKKFDLFLLDVTIANGSGFSLCAKAKELKLPVIFLTASGDENSIVRGLDMGADDYISKPFRPRELVSRIKSVL
ncbi:MAG: response regulator, partial [Lachnospiraceae bacterium]|nr:response regulator [Lachnospiraceae bacterium]